MNQLTPTALRNYLTFLQTAIYTAVCVGVHFRELKRTNCSPLELFVQLWGTLTTGITWVTPSPLSITVPVSVRSPTCLDVQDAAKARTALEKNTHQNQILVRHLPADPTAFQYHSQGQTDTLMVICSMETDLIILYISTQQLRKRRLHKCNFWLLPDIFSATLNHQFLLLHTERDSVLGLIQLLWCGVVFFIYLWCNRYHAPLLWSLL